MELKVHPEESFEEVIGRQVKRAFDDESLSEGTIKMIRESMEDIKAGMVYSLEDILEEFGLQ